MILRNFMKKILISKMWHTLYRKIKMMKKYRILVTGGAGFLDPLQKD